MFALLNNFVTWPDRMRLSPTWLIDGPDPRATILELTVIIFSISDARGFVLVGQNNKEEEYASTGGQYLIAPIALETLGHINTPACQLFANLGRKISSTSGDEREGAFLFCREFRCRCNVTTLSCYMTPCQPLTARTDDLYPFVYCLNF